MRNVSKPYLIQAYKKTTYRVDNPLLEIGINRCHSKLDQLLHDSGANEWMFITAWNPGSRELTMEENEHRNNRLEAEFGNKLYFQGSGIPDNDRWEPEKSFLVFGYSKDEAMELGRKYGQNAVVFGYLKSRAELIFL